MLGTEEAKGGWRGDVQIDPEDVPAPVCLPLPRLFGFYEILETPGPPLLLLWAWPPQQLLMSGVAARNVESRERAKGDMWDEGGHLLKDSLLYGPTCPHASAILLSTFVNKVLLEQLVLIHSHTACSCSRASQGHLHVRLYFFEGLYFKFLYTLESRQRVL